MKWILLLLLHSISLGFKCPDWMATNNTLVKEKWEINSSSSMVISKFKINKACEYSNNGIYLIGKVSLNLTDTDTKDLVTIVSKEKTKTFDIQITNELYEWYQHDTYFISYSKEDKLTIFKYESSKTKVVGYSLPFKSKSTEDILKINQADGSIFIAHQDLHTNIIWKAYSFQPNQSLEWFSNTVSGFLRHLIIINKINWIYKWRWM